MLGHPKFTDWYYGQDRIFSHIMDWATSKTPGTPKFMCAAIPTGSGKSLMAVLTARMSGMRSAYLTATKGLQEQLTSDFERIGMVDIRGQNSYTCRLSQDPGPVVAGMLKLQALCEMFEITQAARGLCFSNP